MPQTAIDPSPNASYNAQNDPVKFRHNRPAQEYTPLPTLNHQCPNLSGITTGAIKLQL